VRVISTAQQHVLDSGVQGEWCRLSVKDADGNWRDLTTWPGFNAVKSVSWKSAVNDPHGTFSATLLRELYQLSLAPLMQDSALNRAFDPGASYAPLIAPNRDVKIEVAITMIDTPPESGDWFQVFRGRIDTVNAASSTDVAISGRSQSGRLAQQYIKYERVYAFGADGGPVSMRVWSPEMVLTSGEYVCPASRGEDDPGFNKFFVVASSGTAGTVEPTWTTGTGITDGSATHDYVGAPTVTGFPVEAEMQLIIDDNVGIGDTAPILHVAVSPSWDVTQWLQSRGFTWDALDALAGQIGWDLRDKWSVADTDWRLEFYEPDRTVSTPDFTFGPSDYGHIEQLSVDIAEIRNAVRIIYKDSTDLWPDGTPKRKVLDDSEPDSITKYGELWCEIQEDETSNIDTEVEAQRLADALLSDCAEPTAVMRAPLARGFPWAELNDYYTFTANDLQFSEDLSEAVTDISQTFENGRLKTQLGLRGQPTAGHRRYIEKQQHRHNTFGLGSGTNHRFDHFQGPKTPKLAFDPTVGGTRISLSTDVDKRALPEEFELHVYKDTATPLDDSTLSSVGALRNVEVSQLEPGADYYAVVVPRFYNGLQLVRGQPSKEQLFTAGRAKAGHLEGGIALGGYPLNGGFETRFDPAGMPDHWVLGAGATLGTSVQVVEDGSGISGSRFVRFDSAPGGDPCIIESAQFPVINDRADGSDRYSQLYRASFRLRNDAGNPSGGGIIATINTYDSAGIFSSSTGATIAGSDEKPGKWILKQFIYEVTFDPAARSMSLQLSDDNEGDEFVTDLDELRFEWIGTPWFYVGDTSHYTDAYEQIPNFSGTWVNFDSGTHTKAAFRRDQTGRVWLKGFIKSGTINTAAFVLPPSFRPTTSNVNFAVDANSAHGRVEIDTSGNVTPVSGSTTSISLDGLNFMPGLP
jgi:hypothetical protein